MLAPLSFSEQRELDSHSAARLFDHLIELRMSDFYVGDLLLPLADVLDEIHLDDGVADLLDFAAGLADLRGWDLPFLGQQSLFLRQGFFHLGCDDRLHVNFLLPVCCPDVLEAPVFS